jgi:ubiquinol-cytochrome c reductase cytochrome c subunit
MTEPTAPRSADESDEGPDGLEDTLGGDPDEHDDLEAAEGPEDELDDDLDDEDDEDGTEPTGTAHVVRPRRTRRGAGRAGRWQRRASGALVLGIALCFLGVGYAAVAPSADGAPAEDIAAGRELYQNACIACHGRNLQGLQGRGPSLIGVGEAAVYFQVATGRMPLARQEAQAAEKPPQFTDEEVRQLAAFVQSIGGGPLIPANPDGVLHKNTDALAMGGDLYRLNCAQCHNFAGQGGALSSGKHAPGLGEASDEILYTAMLTGPENMPVFGDNQLTPEQKSAIITYVQTLKASKDPGGHGLGRLGPVPEGIVLWVAGIGALMVMVLWIGSKS